MSSFRRAVYSDIPLIQKFIHENFKKDHILSKNKALFVNEYVQQTNTLDQDAEINFYVYSHNQKIVSILGFYEYSEEYYLSLWSALKGSFYGIVLLKAVEKALSDKPLRVIGLSSEAITLYKNLSYVVGKLNYQYFTKNTKKSTKKGISLDKKEIINAIGKDDNLVFYEKHLVRNPFVTYSSYYFLKERIQIIYRKVTTPENVFILVVDIIGDIESVNLSMFQEVLDEENVEYGTLYASESFDFLQDVSDSELVFSIYAHPYVAKNIDVHYAYKGEKPRIFKLRGDQERPASLNEKYAIVNNFMYHYIRDSDIKQTVNNYLPQNIFEKHLTFLQKNYSNLKLIDLQNGDFSEIEEYYMLSFDDGYIEHEEFVAKLLTKNGVEGHFFVPKIENDTLLKVNKIHQILNFFSVEEILSTIKTTVNGQEFTELFKKYVAKSEFDDENTMFIKRYFQKNERAITVINELFSRIPSSNYKDYYINEKQLKNMADFHIVGNHTCAHNHLTEYSIDEIDKDIRSYEVKFSEYMNLKTVSYPYGSIYPEAMQLYEKYDYKYGFTVKSGYDIIPQSGKLDINRYDCNELTMIINRKDEKK
ncbi:hypothetical protein BFR40_07010 [Brochothrix thermosphacta]|uniref:polysaccharide deacetylase family protein n=1 Tax=Brochothrix thermosphacta TaxID=2756 RepID=UPI00083FC1F2|nr:polysaccharide deacetylase family protein [Brochothrix thermosphacta]ODJ51744.1 hypothetical protein BFR40_07010 [Brochothrix thermosphacta]WKK68380.1 polysaccharide deacetylase family protein [Brochothrix thermosphacta]